MLFFRRASAAPAQPTANAPTESTPANSQHHADSIASAIDTNTTTSTQSVPALAAAVAAVNNPPPSEAKKRPSMLSTCTIGVDNEPNQNEDLDNVRRIHIKNIKDPKEIESAFQDVVDVVEAMTVKARDNDVILYQMLAMMEERINKRIDQVKEELINTIDAKIAAIPPPPPVTMHQPVPLAAPLPRGSVRSSIYKPGHQPNLSGNSLSALFEEASNHSGSKPPTPEPTIIYEDSEVTPLPGFVIKTKKLVGTKDKVFINVFHHDSIEYIPVSLPAKDKAAALDNRPLLIMGNATNSLDKEGQNCVTYNVGVSSQYFQQPNPDITDFNITSPTSIHKIIHKINIKFGDFLDESSYSLPRLANGFKGDEIPILHVPVPAKPKEHPKPAIIDDNMSVFSEVTMDHRLSASNPNRRPSGTDIMETGSVADTHKTSTKRKLNRKSIFDTSQHAMNSGNIVGRNMLSGNMLEYIRDECVDGKTANGLKDASGDNPHVLLGWQIQYTDDKGATDLYVVTDVRKNLLNKTEFRISKFFAEDAWVRLKRGDGRPGNEFRPMRKVLFGLGDDDDQYSVA